MSAAVGPARRRGHPAVRRRAARVRNDTQGARARHRVGGRRPRPRGRGPGERRPAVEATARALGLSALDRIDANRTARLELLAVIGDADKPWVGAALGATEVGVGTREAGTLAAAGVDVIQVSVPAIRELADRLHDEGVDVPFWRPRPSPGSGATATEVQAEPAPAGSQRGLAELRQAVDAAAAERRAYARLATVALPLAAPEQAVVAAFERIDIVAADVVSEIVDGNVDPDDGCSVTCTLEPCLAAPAWLSRCRQAQLSSSGPGRRPSDATPRAGRALALQLVGVFLARLHGVPPGRLLVGALPPWLLEERGPAAAAIAQVAVRRAVLPDHPLAFEEPVPGTHAAIGWPSILGAALPVAGHAGLILRSVRGEGVLETVAATRAAAAVAAETAGSLGPLRPRGPALTTARATVAAAVATLERVAAVAGRRSSASRSRPPTRSPRGGCGRRADRVVRSARG
jgi:hypothetical protein